MDTGADHPVVVPVATDRSRPMDHPEDSCPTMTFDRDPDSTDRDVVATANETTAAPAISNHHHPDREKQVDRDVADVVDVAQVAVAVAVAEEVDRHNHHSPTRTILRPDR